MKYKINKGFIVQKLDNKTVIFDGEESVLHTFNKTASVIFQKLKNGWEKEKIIAFLINNYQVKKDQAERDFDGLINDLLKRKIVSSSSAVTPKKLHK